MFDLLLLIVIGSSKKPIWMFQTTEHYFSICGCYVSAKTKTWVLTASCPSIKEYCNSQNSFNFQSRMCTMRRSTITASLWCNLNRFFFHFQRLNEKESSLSFDFTLLIAKESELGNSSIIAIKKGLFFQYGGKKMLDGK